MPRFLEEKLKKETMSHPNPLYDPENSHKRDADERGFRFEKKAKYNSKTKALEGAKVHSPKFKLGESKSYKELQARLAKRKQYEMGRL